LSMHRMNDFRQALWRDFSATLAECVRGRSPGEGVCKRLVSKANYRRYLGVVSFILRTKIVSRVPRSTPAGIPGGNWPGDPAEAGRPLKDGNRAPELKG